MRYLVLKELFYELKFSKCLASNRYRRIQSHDLNVIGNKPIIILPRDRECEWEKKKSRINVRRVENSLLVNFAHFPVIGFIQTIKQRKAEKLYCVVCVIDVAFILESLPACEVFVKMAFAENRVIENVPTLHWVCHRAVSLIRTICVSICLVSVVIVVVVVGGVFIFFFPFSTTTYHHEPLQTKR